MRGPRPAERPKKGDQAHGTIESIDNPVTLRGSDPAQVEKLADQKFLQQGWTRKPLSDGNGVRYYDGKDNSFQINRGYPDGEGLHGGPYLK